MDVITPFTAFLTGLLLGMAVLIGTRAEDQVYPTPLERGYWIRFEDRNEHWYCRVEKDSTKCTLYNRTDKLGDLPNNKPVSVTPDAA